MIVQVKIMYLNTSTEPDTSTTLKAVSHKHSIQQHHHTNIIVIIIIKNPYKMSQSSNTTVHIPNNNTDQSEKVFQTKSDLALYGSPVQIRQNRNMARRASSFVKMTTEDNNQVEMDANPQRPPARLIRSDARRGSSFVKAMSEDMGEDHLSRYLTKPLIRQDRRGSSFLMVDDEINSSNKSTPKDIRRGSSFIRTTDDSLQHEASSDHLTPRSSSLTTSKDIRRGSSFIRTADDSLEDTLSQNRSPRLEMRRGSSFIRMISEDINNDEMHSTGRLSSKPSERSESRRGSNISRMLSEDSSEDSISRRSSRADIRRGSSFARMISEEQEDENKIDRSDISDKLRKSIDNNSYRQRHSLESISEYKTQTFSSASLYPSIDYSSIETTSDFSSDFALRTITNENNDELNSDRTFVNSSLSYLSWIESVTNDCPDSNQMNQIPQQLPENDNRYGEWHSFWTNYNSSRNEYFSNPYLCPSNSGDLSYESNGSTQRGFTDKSLTDNVVLTVDEATEAIHCTQKLLDILKSALKRSETEILISKQEAEEQNLQNLSKEDKKSEDKDTEKEKTSLKPSNNSCIDVILSHTGVADILKRVINKRRDVIMPPDESSGNTSRNSGSDWSIKK